MTSTSVNPISIFLILDLSPGVMAFSDLFQVPYEIYNNEGMLAGILSFLPCVLVHLHGALGPLHNADKKDLT